MSEQTLKDFSGFPFIFQVSKLIYICGMFKESGKQSFIKLLPHSS